MNKSKTQLEKLTADFVFEVLKTKPEERERARLMLLSMEESEQIKQFINEVFALVRETLPLGIEMKEQTAN